MSPGFKAKTDQAGRWRVCRVAPELVRNLDLSASHPDLGVGAWMHVGKEPEVEAQLRAGSHTFHLTPATNVCGVVVDPEGRLVSGATVRVGEMYIVGAHTSRTDQDGWFNLAGCELGSVLITGEAEGFAPTTTRITLTNFAPVKLVLSRGQPLKVRALDHDGNPIVKATVDVGPNLEKRNPDTSLALPQVFSTENISDATGLAVFPALPDYDLWVGVSAPGFMRQAGIEARAGSPELAVRLLTNLVVSGTVRDGVTGKSVPKFRIEPSGPNPAGGRLTSAI